MTEAVPLIPWMDRPHEEAALLNPAFCGELIARAVAAHDKLSARRFSLPLAYAVLPLVLHSLSRTSLPARADATFRTWALANEATISSLPQRVASLSPITRESLIFLVQQNACKIDAFGLSVGARPLAFGRKLDPSTTETHDIRRAAGLLGRWFAAQSGPSPILQTLGLRP